MDNHYVSQLIIKRFSKAINIFDITTGKIDEQKRPEKVFYEKDKFPRELDALFNEKIESRFANLLDKKLLVEGDITITREELILIKKYMLMCSVRTQDPDMFYDFLIEYENTADRYINTLILFGCDFSSLKKTKELNLSKKEIYLRALDVFAKTSDIRDIGNNQNATREMLAWAMPFLESYVAFWDAPKDKEFILTDCGMCSEYEGIYKITGGHSLSKFTYLLNKVKNREGQYIKLLASSDIMYENYNIFNLNSKRCLIMINPFFSLYYGLYSPKESRKIICKPDIWPAIIQDKLLFETPTKEPFINQTIFSDKDLFCYKPKTLNEEDYIYLNSIMLSQAHEIIGFNDASKIIDSIYYFIWESSNIKSVKYIDQPDDQIFENLIEETLKSPFNYLCNHCIKKGGENKTQVIELFENIIRNIYKDFDNNPYILEYLLNNSDEVVNNKRFDFLGSGEKRLEVIKEMLDAIKEVKKNDK